MRIRLHHPLWTHFPALGCIAINLGLLLSARLPVRVVTDFENGSADAWGSPLDLWMAMIVWPLVLVVGSAVLDESWARIEQQERRFNWISLLDECVLGFSLGKNIAMVPQLSKPEPAPSEWWWLLALLIAVAAAAFAVLLELRRPCHRGREVDAGVSELARSIQEQFQSGRRWLYWETQDSFWSRCLILLISAPALVLAGESVRTSHYGGGVIFASLAVFLILFFGGVHISVTQEKVAVRGRFGLPLLRLELSEIASLEKVTFSPLLDFLGWGFYRYSPRLHAWGLYVTGGGGVIVQTRKGRRFLIGSKSPNRLAAAIEASTAAVLNLTSPDRLQRQTGLIGRMLHISYQAFIGIGLVLIVALALHDPSSVKYTITSKGLTIHDMFYSVTVNSADIEVERIKIVDIGVDPFWRPTQKIKGTSSKRYKAGWFRVAGGEKIRLYRTTGQRLVLLPPKGKGAPVLMEAKQPEAFIQELRQAWQ